MQIRRLPSDLRWTYLDIKVLPDTKFPTEKDGGSTNHVRRRCKLGRARVGTIPGERVGRDMLTRAR
jgi:hypothetical protein